MTINIKKKYKELCLTDESVPFFLRPYWLDKVLGEKNWNVRVIIEQGEIQAALPYVIQKRYLFLKALTETRITNHFGIWIREIKALSHKALLTRKYELIEKIIQGLPQVDIFDQHFDAEVLGDNKPILQYGDCYKKYDYTLENEEAIPSLTLNDRNSFQTRSTLKDHHHRELRTNEIPDIATFVKHLHPKVARKGQKRIRKAIQQVIKDGNGDLYIKLNSRSDLCAGCFIIKSRDTASMAMKAYSKNCKAYADLNSFIKEVTSTVFMDTNIQRFKSNGNLSDVEKKIYEEIGAKKRAHYRVVSYQNIILRRLVSIIRKILRLNNPNVIT